MPNDFNAKARRAGDVKAVNTFFVDPLAPGLLRAFVSNRNARQSS